MKQTHSYMLCILRTILFLASWVLLRWDRDNLGLLLGFLAFATLIGEFVYAVITVDDVKNPEGHPKKNNTANFFHWTSWRILLTAVLFLLLLAGSILFWLNKENTGVLLRILVIGILLVELIHVVISTVCQKKSGKIAKKGSK